MTTYAFSPALVRQHVPAELQCENRWVAWDKRPRKDGRPGKEPVSAKTGKVAATNKPETWGSFDAAIQFALGHSERIGGIGYVLSGGAHWCLDLDHVIDVTSGTPAPSAALFLNNIDNSYTEISPSGTGLHVVMKGERPARLAKTRCEGAFGEGTALEVFGGGSARYITFTGQLYESRSTLLVPADQTIDIVAAFFDASEQTPGRRGAGILLATTMVAAIGDALRHVPADDRDVWLRIGMALKSTGAEEQARAIWCEWSRTSDKYDELVQQETWRSLHQNPNGGITLATLFWEARKHGWSGHSREPSVSASSGHRPIFRPLKPLPPELLPVAPFDPDLLPVAFRDLVIDIADRIQCPADFPAVASMVVYSSLVGRKIGIRPKRRDDWLVVPNLWGDVIGRPGVMKTPGIREMLKFLTRLEIKAKGEFEAEMKRHEADVIIGKARRKEAENKVRDAIKNGTDPSAFARDAIQEDGGPPQRRRYLTNDSTVEKLGELLNENPNGILVFRDELVGWLRSLDKEGQEGARAFYLEAWDGSGRFVFDRIGRGTIDIEAATVSVFGGIQPGPLQTYLRGVIESGKGDDGLVQRLQLAVWPDVSREWLNVDRWPDVTSKFQAFTAFETADTLSWEKLGAQREGSEIPHLRFDDAAQVRFDDWRTELELKVRNGSEHPAIESHLAKYRSLVPSIALLLHIADGHRGAVCDACAGRAIRWATYLETHARRIYGSAIGHSQEARALAEHIFNGDLVDGFALRDVYRPCWTWLHGAQAALRGAAMLVSLGWLAEEERQSSTKSGTVYRINPLVWKLTKREVVDQSLGSVSSVGGSPSSSADSSPSNDHPEAGAVGDQQGDQNTDMAPEGADGTDRSPASDGRVEPAADQPRENESEATDRTDGSGHGGETVSSVSHLPNQFGDSADELSQTDRPPDRCSACGGRSWWRYGAGRWICSRCHPPLPGLVVEKRTSANHGGPA